MENASKALIIAGAILISIIIVALGVTVVRQGQSTSGRGQQALSEAEMTEFNLRFQPYVGHKSKTQVEALYDDLRTYNINNEKTLPITYGTNTFDGVSTGKTTIPTLSKSFYSVSLNMENGLVTGITITE